MATRPTSAGGEARQLALKKLHSSGLNETDMKLLRMDALEGTQVVALEDCFKPIPSLRIPYFDPRTDKPLTPRPKWPAFYRLRYLKQASDFSAQVKRPIRYVQPPDSGVCAYFPTNVAWKEILKDASQPLIITEGELKAAKACKEGFPTIGLGGVRNFMSTRLNEILLPELEAVNWVKRSVFIIYDSDFRTNEHICSAMNVLAERLFNLGAEPHFVPLPDMTPDEGKTGLDDFLVHSKKKDALRDLINDNAEALTLSKSLWKLNEKVLYVRDPGLVLVRESSQKISPNSFTAHAYSNVSTAEREVRPDGSVSLKLVPAAPAWLSWSFRAEASKLTYEPGQPQVTKAGAFNMWSGWGVEPRKGDASLFLKLIDHIFHGASPAEKTWFLRWLAYPIQHPGKKLFTNVLIHGIQQGTGKSLIGYTVGQIYGSNFTEIKQTDLESSFTAWAENKQFILADDITGSDSRKHADILKTLTTQLEMKINIKYVPEFKVPDCVNYLFTSNQPDAFFMENHDRRSFIWEVLLGPLPEAFYKEYDKALKQDPEKKLAAAVFHYLLNLDLGGFNPNAPAMSTLAKEIMISDTKSDLGAWVAQLKADPDHVLRVGKVKVVGDLFTSQELLRYYDPTGGRSATANGLARELRRSGIMMFRDGVPLRSDKGLHRYFVVRNVEKWAKASPAVATKYLNSLK